MKTKLVRILIFLVFSFFSFSSFSQVNKDNYNSLIEHFNNIPPKRLLELADEFTKRNAKDSALLCYALIYNQRLEDTDTVSHQMASKALNRASLIYYYACDYKTSYELLLRALDVCEKIGYNEYTVRVYNNIGNIHVSFHEYNSAIKYYELALNQSKESYIISSALNNLGTVAHLKNEYKEALALYKRAYAIILESDSVIYSTANNLGSIYKELKNTDSAFYYYNLALINAQYFKQKQKEAKILSHIGMLYCDLKKYDLSIKYLAESSAISNECGFLNVLADNYKTLSKLEETKGNISKAFLYYQQYSELYDSIYNASNYANISELHSLHEMAKVDKQLQEMNTEQMLKERTIKMQRAFQLVLMVSLLAAIGFVFLLFRKNKTLDKAYNILFIKNKEIVVQDQKLETLIKELSQQQNGTQIKYQTSSLTETYKDELIVEILKVMEKKEVVCDVEFSLDKLAELTNSNPKYISQAINDSFKQNFRSFINEIRIKEALKLLSSDEGKKYSIESIGLMVGFKSRRSFDTIFKEITGISPSFYFKSNQI